MKKIIIAAVLFLSANISAQVVKSIENKHSELIINDTISLKKGEQIQVYLPAGQDFVFVKSKKSKFSTKLLGNVADIVGTGASAVGMGTGNIKVLENSVKVVNAARTVQYSADAIDKIQELNISDKAKKIAGKKMEILSWEFTEDGYVLTAEYDKKKYEIYLQEAIMAGEVNIMNTKLSKSE